MEVSVDLICVGGLNVRCRESGTRVPGFTSRLRHRLSGLGLYTIFFLSSYKWPGHYLKLAPLPHVSTLNLARY